MPARSATPPPAHRSLTAPAARGPVRPRSGALRPALATAAAVAVLAGCSFATGAGRDDAGPTEPTATTQPAETTAPSATTPPATTAPESTDPSTPAQDLPVLSWIGLGELRYGMTPDQASAALGVDLVPSEAYAGMREDLECGYLAPDAAGGLPEGIAVMVTGPGEGTVARVDVGSGPWRTDRGIGIGDDVAAVTALQSEGIADDPAPYGDGRQITVDPLDDAASTAEVFDVGPDGKVAGFRAGQRPEVGYVEGCV